MENAASDALPVAPYTPVHPKGTQSKGGAERRLQSKGAINGRRVVSVPEHFVENGAAVRVDPEQIAEEHIRKLMQRAREASLGGEGSKAGVDNGNITSSSRSALVTVNSMSSLVGVGIVQPGSATRHQSSTGVLSSPTGSGEFRLRDAENVSNGDNARRLMSDASEAVTPFQQRPSATQMQQIPGDSFSLPPIALIGGKPSGATTANSANDTGKDPILPQRITGYSKEQHIKYLETYTARHCASTRSLEARCEGYCRVIDAICDLHPGFVNLYSTVKHFIKELIGVIHTERKQYAEKLVKMKKDIHSRQQAFYEEKFLKAMSEKAHWQKMAQSLSSDVASLKRSRDDDLMESKKAVLGAVMKVKEDEEELNSVRALVTTVFQVAKDHEARAEQLAKVLEANRIAIPPKSVLDEQQTRRPQPQVHPPISESRFSDGHGDEVDDLEQSASALSPRQKPTPVSQRSAPTIAERRKQQMRGAAAVDAIMKEEASSGMPNLDMGALVEGDETHDDTALRQFQQPALRQQVTIDFIEASRRELEQCRLSTQRVLVSCASESQSSFKLLIGSLKSENDKLRAEVHQLQEAKLAMERYVHEKRFMMKERDDIDRDETLLEGLPVSAIIPPGDDSMEARKRALWNRDGSTAKKATVPSLPIVSVSQVMSRGPPPADVPREQLTPRPVFPFEVQPALGVDLRQSSGRIAAELSAVAMNLKQANDELHVRIRRLASAVTWMDEFSINKIVLAHSDDAFLRVAPSAEWDQCHHFLRTTVQPHVPNLNWTSQLTSFVVWKLFDSFSSVREAARYERDLKMLAPRVYQPYERRYHTLVRLDATADECTASVDNVPLGYVVTQFIIQELLSHSARNALSPELLQSRRVAPTVRHRVLEVPIEAEFAKVAYNLWYSARKYRAVEPLCELFVNVIEGRLPVETFDATQRVHQALLKKLNNMEGVRSGGATYNQLTGAVSSMLQDQAPDIVRGGVLAVSQTMELKGIPVIGKIALQEVVADETRTIAGGGSVGSPRSQQPPKVLNSNTTGTIPLLLANGALLALPNSPISSPANAFVGASLLTRYFRRLVMQKMEAIFRQLEALCFPHVRESTAVRGMFLLKISACVAATTAFDQNPTPFLTQPSTGIAAPSAGPVVINPPKGIVGPSAAAAGSTSIMMGMGMSLSTAPIGENGASSFNATTTPMWHSQQYGMTMPMSPVTPDTRPNSPPDMPQNTTTTSSYSSLPPYLHISSVPISIGTMVTPHQLLMLPCSLSENFHQVVSRMGMQRYSSSIHFPPPKVDETATSPEKTEGSASPKKSGRRRSLKKSGGPIQPLALDDSDWVEWYAFCAALRTTPLLLKDAFVDGWKPRVASSEAAGTSQADDAATLPAVNGLR